MNTYQQAEARPLQRFMSLVRIDDESGCWHWMGKRDRNGYGRFSISNRWVQAHRWAYMALVGAVPACLDLDHLCRVHDCVGPDHLEPVTRQVNLLRGETIPAAHAAKTHCPQGHPYDDANTYLYRGMRQCRTCRTARDRSRVRTNNGVSRLRALDLVKGSGVLCASDDLFIGGGS